MQNSSNKIKLMKLNLSRYKKKKEQKQIEDEDCQQDSLSWIGDEDNLNKTDWHSFNIISPIKCEKDQSILVLLNILKLLIVFILIKICSR